MISNLHTHTARCGHAKGRDREYVEAAIKGGFKYLGFADHCPWIYENGYVSGSRMLPGDIDEYFKSLTELKKEYSGDIELLIGFECEYVPELMAEQDRLFADYPVDYLILGQHSIAPEYDSPYTGRPTDDEAAFVRYTDLVIEGMESGRYLYLAHPDLFNFTGDDRVRQREYRRLCEYLRAKEQPVEINLLGLRDGRHYPSELFFSIAAETGCKAVIGIDAHSPHNLSDREPIEKCVEFAQRHGLKLIEPIELLK